MRCIKCGKPLTNIPKYIDQVVQCSCGTKYYIEVGDKSDVIESIADFFDVLELDKFIIKQEGDRIVAEYHDKRAIAILAEKAKSLDDLDLWFVFFD